MGRMTVAAGGTCMGSAAELTSTGKWDKQAKQRIIVTFYKKKKEKAINMWSALFILPAR